MDQREIESVGFGFQFAWIVRNLDFARATFRKHGIEGDGQSELERGCALGIVVLFDGE